MSNSRFLFALITLCSACGGSSFVAGGTGGTSAEAGATGSDAGDTSSAGASSGGSGAESSAGASGQPAGGAATAGAGGSSAAGAGAGGAGAGGAGAGGSSAGAGTGGSHAGAGGSSGGAGGGADCVTLKADYAAALEKARQCDMGSLSQCDKSSTLPNLGCGCPTLVAAKTAATALAKQKYQAFQDAKCPVGPICNIACIAYTGATCSAQATGNVCTGSNAATPN